MKYLLYVAVLFIVACQSKSKTPLEGKWEFERNEIYPNVELNAFQDSMINALGVQQKGLTIEFNGSNFKASMIKDGKESPMGNQPFELPADQKSLVLKNNGRPDDVFPIVSLSDSILKINMFQSKEAYLVFRKAK